MGELPSRYAFRDLLLPAQRRLQYGVNGSQELIPCARVENSELQVGVLGLKNLKPERFRIRGARDRQPIVLYDVLAEEQLTLSYPGKSASLYFGENTTPDLQEVVH